MEKKIYKHLNLSEREKISISWKMGGAHLNGLVPKCTPFVILLLTIKHNKNFIMGGS